MGNCINRIPGVVKIWRVKISALPQNTGMTGVAGVKILAPTNFMTEINFAGKPEFTSSKKIENNGEVSEASLTFMTDQVIPTYGGAFVIKTANGEGYLIGSDTRHAKVEVSSTAGSPGGDQNIWTYKVSFKDEITPVKCYI